MPRKNNTPRLNRRELPLRTCTTKRVFRREDMAQRAAEQQMLLQPSLELEVYRCSDCHYWHLTRKK